MGPSARRIGIQLPLGFSSGLPLWLTGATLTAWLQDAGVDIVAIGAFSLVALPYNFKFLWAPFLDRFPVPVLGRRRGWILLMQLALAAALFVMGMIDAGVQPGTIAIIAVAVACLSASQDVVIDAYRTDLLESGERGRGTAHYVTGYRIGMIAAGAGALILADYTSWRVTYWIMAGMLAASTVATVLAPEPSRTHQPRSLADAVILPLVDFFRRRGALLVLLFVGLYKFGDALAAHFITPFLLDIGFPKAEIGLMQKFGGMAATILGAYIGGALADKYGVMRSLILFGILQSFANVGYIALVYVGPSDVGLGLAVFIDYFCTGMGLAAFVAFLMSLCDERYSATQYALLTSASSILGRLFGAGGGWLQQRVGWAGFFAFTVVVAIPALLVLLWYRKVAEPAPSHE
jgi:PAT family beta-lactamase induction signal transducer AmpG